MKLVKRISLRFREFSSLAREFRLGKFALFAREKTHAAGKLYTININTRVYVYIYIYERTLTKPLPGY